MVCFRTVVAGVSLLAVVSCGLGEDWPQWRGPGRNGVAGRGPALAAVPIEFPPNDGQDGDPDAGSVADHEGRDRFAHGQDPPERMIRPWRKDDVISAGRMADDRIAGCP